MTDSFEEGKRLAKAGDFEAALPRLEAASREWSESPDVWLALAACYFRLDRNDDFRDAIRHALAIDPHHAPTRRFLKTTTGGEAIPAADTGREKIYMMEKEGRFEETVGTPEKRSSGCMGLLIGTLMGGVTGIWIGSLLDLCAGFQLY